MKNYTAQGFVLRRYNLGEADKILTIFTYELGKIKVVAKGVRRGKAKLAGHLEPFCLVNLRFVKGKSLDLIIGAEATKIYAIQDKQESALLSAYLFNEILDKMLPEEQPNELAYGLLQESLEGLSEGIDALLVRQYFTLKFLQTIGSQPELAHTVLGSRHYVSYDSGEVVPTRPNAHYGLISDDTIKFWRLIYTNPLKSIARVEGIANILVESNSLLMHYYEYHFHLQFKSPKVFQDSSM